MEEFIFNFKVNLEEDWNLEREPGALAVDIPYGLKNKPTMARIEKNGCSSRIDVLAYERNINVSEGYLRDLSYDHRELGGKSSKCTLGDFSGTSTFWREGDFFVKQWDVGIKKSVILLRFSCRKGDRKNDLPIAESILSSMKMIDMSDYHKSLLPPDYIKDRTEYTVIILPESVDKKYFIKLIQDYQGLSVIDAAKVFKSGSAVELLSGRGTPIYKLCSSLCDKGIKFMVTPDYPYVKSG